MKKLFLLAFILLIILTIINCSTPDGEGYGGGDSSYWSTSVVDQLGSVSEMAINSTDRSSVEEYAEQPLEASGGQPSLILTSTESLAISYYKFSTYDAKYAYWNGSSWDKTIIDENYAGAGSSLKLNLIGNPCFSYLTYLYNGYKLKYASYSSSGWTIEEVSAGDAQGNSSLVFDRLGNPHISYGKGQVPRILTHVYWNGSIWVEETVDNSTAVAVDSCIGIDSSDVLHISYRVWVSVDGTYYDQLKHAWKSGSSWETELIHETLTVGGWDKTSLCIDSSDNLHILARLYEINEGTGFLSTYIFYANNSSGIWVVENIGRGYDSAMDLDSNDNPHVCYYGSVDDQGGLIYAYKKNGVWSTEVAISSGVLQGNPSIILDSSDRPYIAYSAICDDTSFCLLVASINELRIF